MICAGPNGQRGVPRRASWNKIKEPSNEENDLMATAVKIEVVRESEHIIPLDVESDDDADHVASALQAHVQLQNAETNYEALSGSTCREDSVSPRSYKSGSCWGMDMDDVQDDDQANDYDVLEATHCVAGLVQLACSLQYSIL